MPIGESPKPNEMRGRAAQYDGKRKDQEHIKLRVLSERRKETLSQYGIVKTAPQICMRLLREALIKCP
jgi:DNA polymerase/3'-5' exonuclease PolX